jgi:hypothetical protein
MKDLALAGCILGAFSDWLDGYIAKNYNLKVPIYLLLLLSLLYLPSSTEYLGWNLRSNC